ncbi:hypothetical protein FN846DRAFT_318098 [Sphaerosporella brunnea]|uniref:PLC-like phosphodiesterase n=1 Tax=Sphaerosporella brunnea TaxID=1250544 RepID=A0A5J5EKW4_9PEZI|nr:hypothetical protein FN846DRAFT_318098 [Sphaerosporella brunnea]
MEDQSFSKKDTHPLFHPLLPIGKTNSGFGIENRSSTSTMRLLPAATALLSALLLPLSAAYNKTACNNSPSLCNATYSDILHLGAHNVAFVRTAANGWSEGGNQYFNATVALSAGVRLLQSQLHVRQRLGKAVPHDVRHPRRGVAERLVERDQYLAVNAAERGGDDPAGKRRQDLGRRPLAGSLQLRGWIRWHTYPDGTGWPTLQAMIDKKKQVVAFLSNAADTSKVPYLLPEWNYIFETDFEVSDPANYTCYATRPSAVAGKDKLSTAVASGRMGFMNRFLYDQISTTLKLYVPNSTYAAA